MPVTDAPTRYKPFVAGLIFALLPFVVFFPYRWYVFDYARDSIVTPRIGEEHQRVHLGVWFVYTLLPVWALCFGIAAGLFVRSRQHFRIAYVFAVMSALACMFAVFILISPFLGL